MWDKLKISGSIKILTDDKKLSELNFLLLLFCFNLIIRTIWILFITPEPVSDFKFFYSSGVRISENLAYTDEFHKLTAYWPVGYPGFLGLLFSIFSPAVSVGRIANVLLSSLMTVFLYKYFFKISNRIIISRFAIVIVSFFPSQIAYCSLLSDSVFFGFMLFLGLFLLTSSKSLFTSWLSGIVFGISVLVRPYAVLIPFAHLLASHRNQPAYPAIKNSLMILFGISLVVAPWLYRNYTVFNDFVFVSNNGGINLLIGNSFLSTGGYTEEPLKLLVQEPPDDEIARDKLARNIALNYIAGHPFKSIMGVGKKILFLFYEDAESFRWNIKGLRKMDSNKYSNIEYLVMALFEIYYLIVLMGFIAFCYYRFVLKRFDLDLHMGGMAVIFCFILVAMVFFGSSRFHFPIIPLISFYSSYYFVTRIVSRQSANNVSI